MPDKTEQSTERAVGRRKRASARVRIEPGSGEIVINGRTLKEYFPMLLMQQKVTAPLDVTNRRESLNVSVKVSGGGFRGQAEAVRHGITRALIAWNPELKPLLKAEGFVTRDPREKERKKPGKLRARKGRQWRKR